VAANDLGRAVFAPLFDTAARTPNIARFILLDPTAQTFYVEWDSLVGDTVALLRAEAGHDPYDRALSDLIGELFTRSDIFRTWWAAHNVHLHRAGRPRRTSGQPSTPRTDHPPERNRMRATLIYGAGDVRVENVPDPVPREPTDALVRVLRSQYPDVPGRVFDRTIGLDEMPDGYRAMADREALEVLIRP
jgi:hypothetical protein